MTVRFGRLQHRLPGALSPLALLVILAGASPSRGQEAAVERGPRADRAPSNGGGAPAAPRPAGDSESTEAPQAPPPHPPPQSPTSAWHPGAVAAPCLLRDSTHT